MSQVRDLQNTFFASLTQSAIALFEKYNQENSDVESLPEDARVLLQDKDALVNALQVCVYVCHTPQQGHVYFVWRSTCRSRVLLQDKVALDNAQQVCRAVQLNNWGAYLLLQQSHAAGVWG